MALGVALQLPLALVTRYIIDSALPRKDVHAIDAVIVGLIGLMAVKGAADVVQNYVIVVAREYMNADMQKWLFSHVQRLDLSFFKGSKSGYLTARIYNDVSALGFLVSNALLPSIRDVLTLAVAAALLFVFHWKLAIASLLVVPLFVASLRALSARIKQLSATLQETSAVAWDGMQESLSAMTVVKAFQAEEREAARVVRALREKADASVRKTLMSSLSALAASFIAGGGPLVVLWYGGRMVVHGEITLGTLMAFNICLGYLLFPAQRLMNINSEVQMALAAADRVHDLISMTPKVRDAEQPVVLARVSGAVKFRNVSFSYEPGREVLHRINFEAAPGETIAIVGRNGAGKTTLVNLIPRFYDVQEGSVLVDDIDVRRLRQNDLLRAIGIVPQESLLFGASIRDNLYYGLPGASDEELRRVCVAANAYQFIIEKLPRGFDTQVGERGTRLSGGERQRLAIARAMLRNPAILILDEATSEVDAESERLIQLALADLFRGRTTFVIAHRFSTLLHADKILVLEDGRLIDQGRHGDVFERCSVYRGLCRDQLIGAAGRAEQVPAETGARPPGSSNIPARI
jgi:subfamily B ATP-binding cassette protein MsbA